MKHILMLQCFQATEMTRGQFCEVFGVIEGTTDTTPGYQLKNVATGDVHWQNKEEVDRVSTSLPDDFSDRPQADRPWLAERALHAQRIVELTAEMAKRTPHYQANGTTDVFAENFILPHIEALKQRVAELDEAIRCID